MNTSKTSPTAVDLQFAGHVYTFWLPMKQMLELERNIGQTDNSGRLHPKSVCTVYAELADLLVKDGDEMRWSGYGSALTRELNETIRLGLIGGNCCLIDGEEEEVGPQRASELVNLYGYPERPFIEVASTAFGVLHAVMFGNPLRMPTKAAKAAPKTRKAKA